MGAGADCDPWQGHPYNRKNNINFFNGDPSGKGNGLSLEDASQTTILDKEKAYVAKVLDTLRGFDNLVYEVINEPPASSNVTWQNTIAQYTHTLEDSHAIPWRPVLVEDASPSDAELFSLDGNYTNPSPASGAYVYVIDSDHYNGTSNSVARIAMNVTDAMRYAAGDVASYINAMNLNNAVPWDNTTTGVGKCATMYCLGNDTDSEYLMYFPASSSGEKNLVVASAASSCQWYDITTRATAACTFQGTGAHSYTAPSSHAYLLWVH